MWRNKATVSVNQNAKQEFFVSRCNMSSFSVRCKFFIYDFYIDHTETAFSFHIYHTSIRIKSVIELLILNEINKGAIINVLSVIYNYTFLYLQY